VQAAPLAGSGAVSSHRVKSAREIDPLVRALAALTALAERLGLAFAVLIVLLSAVWALGSAQTRDDFVRELLFGSITHTRYLSFFFGALLVIAIFGLDTRRRSRTAVREAP
jgi:hypothetical protein